MKHIDESMINEFLDDELPADKQHALQAHLERCPVCRQRLGELRELFATLDAVTDVTLATDLSPRILARIHQQTASMSAWFRLALAAQASATLLLLLGIWPSLERWLDQAARAIAQTPIRQPFPEQLLWEQLLEQASQALTSIQDATPTLEIATGQWGLLLAVAFLVWLLGNRLLFTANSNGDTHG